MWEYGGGHWNVGVAVGVTAVAGIALVTALIVSSRRYNLKSPWCSARRKHALTREMWDSFFTDSGQLQDGEKLFKKVRHGGIESNIRPIVWPFLLGVYDLNSSEDERDATRMRKWKAYKILRKKCKILSDAYAKDAKREENKVNRNDCDTTDEVGADGLKDNISHDDGVSAGSSQSSDDGVDDSASKGDPLPANAMDSGSCLEAEEKSSLTEDTSLHDRELSDSDSSVEDLEGMLLYKCEDDGINRENGQLLGRASPKEGSSKSHRTDEDFATWQRIIRLDAIRANDEWIPYAAEQVAVSPEIAHSYAEEVGLIDYSHLETCRTYHAARLVAILEAYAVYDPDIGYCQGMSDLLSPILAVMEKDEEAFWCFVGFMRKARHNFRLDEAGIRRQLSMVSKIIKFKDGRLFRHLEKLQADDCFFVYRMVVVMFRRELTFEQTLLLWEVMWADQAAIRAGIRRSTWGGIILAVPPTDDLLLYAIAASVLQRRKLIIEKYSSMEEIMKECHRMAGHLDVWKLLDDAHNLVAILNDKLSS